MSFIYLASPYSSENSQIRHTRYTQVAKVTAYQMHRGITVYSPIVNCHELAKQYDLPTDIKFWWKHNKAMLEIASEFWILTLDDWKKSKGLLKESQLAIKLQLPIKYIDFMSATIVPEE